MARSPPPRRRAYELTRGRRSASQSLRVMGSQSRTDHGKMTAACRVNAQNIPVETKPNLQLEIAHILLIDVVGYSKLLINEQIEVLQELNRIVQDTKSFRAAEAGNKLIRVATGDGMALFFAAPRSRSDVRWRLARR